MALLMGKASTPRDVITASQRVLTTVTLADGRLYTVL
jgi:hypothetical protein